MNKSDSAIFSQRPTVARVAAQAVIRRRAIRVQQSNGRDVYLFALTAREILQIAEVSRVSRTPLGELIGYQRAEVRQHVADIVEYLDGERPLFPHALILALSPPVEFDAIRGNRMPGDEFATSGTIEIQIPGPDEPKPAWIVDGQQRAAALERTTRHDFPIPVSAFAAETVALQRDQFLRINNTRPLPRSLVSELLPSVSAPLPSRLKAKKLPAELVEALDTDDASPFKGMVRRVSLGDGKKGRGVIATESLVLALSNNLKSGGCLFPYRSLDSDDHDLEAMWRVLIGYWTAVREIFSEAWGLPPEKSRLMHGAGIQAMGHLMDTILAALPPGVSVSEHAHAALGTIASECHWTSGRWTGLDLEWNQVENVAKHTQALSQHLVRLYMARR